MRRSSGRRATGSGAWLAIGAFVVLHGVAMLAWGVTAWVAAAQLAASFICFGAYAVDKAAARTGRRRVSERRLLVLGLIGGWPGAIFAQRMLHHKTSKPAFRRAFAASVAASVLLSAVVLAALQGPSAIGLLP